MVSPMLGTCFGVRHLQKLAEMHVTTTVHGRLPRFWCSILKSACQAQYVASLVGTRHFADLSSVLSAAAHSDLLRQSDPCHGACGRQLQEAIAWQSLRPLHQDEQSWKIFRPVSKALPRSCQQGILRVGIPTLAVGLLYYQAASYE